jgi:hypothetical protein
LSAVMDSPIVEFRTAIVLYSGSGNRSSNMTQSTVQIVAGVLAVVLIGIVILRRKGKKTKDADDEF